MTTNFPILPAFDPTLLVNIFQAQLSQVAARSTPNGHAASAPSNANSATAKDNPPWATLSTPSQQTQDATALSTSNFIDTTKVPLSSNSATDAKTEQDNQKLFALYNAVNTLTHLASMSQRTGLPAGQLEGYNTRFQSGLQQIESYLSKATFNNFTLQAASPSASATSAASVPFTSFGYTGRTIVSDANVPAALPGVSASDSFTISITAGGTKTDVAIDLSAVQGALTADNIIAYANQQLAAGGFTTRLQRVLTQGTIDDPKKAAYGIAINSGSSEHVSLSAAAATPALYLAGTSGTTSATTSTAGSTTNTTPPDQQGRLVKLTNLDTSPQSQFSDTQQPSSGNTTAQSTVVDGNGNVYTLGNATGNFGSQINQGSQDVALSKYDSAGNLLWQRLLGSNGTAAGYGLALDPTGGVVISGSTTSDLTATAIANGNADSFVAKYDGTGVQTWVTQLQTLSNNQAASVSVDSTGGIYIGGQVSGIIGSGQTNAGGGDAYVAKLSSKGKLVYEHQFGTAGSDNVAATATTGDGGLVVASVQNGEAILSKYANGDATTSPVWNVDLGNLSNGALSGLTVSGNQIYLAGTSSNGNLTAGGQASIANASTGGTNAFVFGVTDQGTSVAPDFVSYVGANDGSSKSGAVTPGPDGTIYLTGSTTGTFAGQSRGIPNASNLFVTALGADGSIDWTRQYGGADGQSTGRGIAVDPQGSSVLDALGLPHGAVGREPSVDLASATTVRPGDSFSIAIAGTTTRTTKITIDAGETLSSLITKINGELGQVGQASISYGKGAEGLKITVNPGYTATLVSGPAHFDALARLGISPGALTSPAKTNKTSSGSTSQNGNSSAAHVFGLGLTGTLDISTRIGAGAARAMLMNIQSAIRNAYQTTNAPISSSTTPSATATGPVPAYLQSQIADYNAALQAFGLGNGSTASVSA